MNNGLLVNVPTLPEKYGELPFPLKANYKYPSKGMNREQILYDCLIRYYFWLDYQGGFEKFLEHKRQIEEGLK